MTQQISDVERLGVLLQEHQQYREEVRMFDGHLFRVLLTYVTGLIAAFGWLGSQVIDRSAELVDRAAAQAAGALTLGQASAQVFRELAGGPFFYVFAGVPVITAIMLLLVARDWASLHEKFGLLKVVADAIAEMVQDSRLDGRVMRLDRGYRTEGRSVRQGVETTLILFWVVVAVVLSVFIVNGIDSFAATNERRWFLRGAGGFGLVIGLAGLGVVGLAAMRRSYKSPGETRSVIDEGRI